MVNSVVLFHSLGPPFLPIHKALVLLALFHPPVHDVPNKRAGQETQQLHSAEDRRVEAHWGMHTLHIRYDVLRHPYHKKVTCFYNIVNRFFLPCSSASFTSSSGAEAERKMEENAVCVNTFNTLSALLEIYSLFGPQ